MTAVKGFLLANGYTPMVIVSVTGDYTMDELERMAEGKLYSKEFLADCKPLRLPCPLRASKPF